MPQLRLDKILADSGAASRREARLMIKNGLVTVDGEVCREADRKVDTETSRVCVEGKELRAAAPSPQTKGTRKVSYTHCSAWSRSRSS